MVLGEIYRPKGLALETAQAVLEVKDSFACNVALGCPNNCGYCYIPFVMRKKRGSIVVRYPKIKPVALVRRQLEKGLSPNGVFLCFLTDPFLPRNYANSEELIRFLWSKGILVATLSKITCSTIPETRHGMTVVSLHDRFWKEWEPKTPPPIVRIKLLEAINKNEGENTWISMEPYPPSAIWKQDIKELLEEIKFVDLIVFGRWNYDARARTDDARKEYAENIMILRDFCRSNHIRCHVKSDTLKFCQLLGGSL